MRHCFIANLTTTSSAVHGCRWLVWGQYHSCLLSLQLFIQRCNAKVPGTNQESSLVHMDKHDFIRPFAFSLSRTLALSSPLTQSQHEAALSLSQTWGGTSRCLEKPVHRSNLRGGYNVAAGMLTGPELKALHSALLLHTEHVKCAFDTTFCHSECTDSAKRKEKSVSPTHKNI